MKGSVSKPQRRTLLDLKFVKLRSSVTEFIDLTGEDAEEVSNLSTVSKLETKVSAVERVVVARKNTFGKSGRVMPWFKKMEFDDINIAVDCFNCEKEDNIQVYFLSHFHSDHYVGLKKSWCNGRTIFASPLTAKLVRWKFKVNACEIRELEHDCWVFVTEKLRVMALDANHCPGSSIFLFHSVPGDEYVLHTGDFRATLSMAEKINSITSNAKLQKLYLDTTYLNPFFKFPPLDLVCEVTANFAGQLARNGVDSFLNGSRRQRSISEYLNLSQRKPNLFVVLSYSIGKEHLAISIAKRLNSRIYVPHTKYQMVKQYVEWFPDDLVTTDLEGSNVHLVSMHGNLEKYLSQIQDQYESIVIFKPTGWTFTNKFNSSYKNWNDDEMKKWVFQTLSSDTPFSVDHILSQKSKREGKIHYFDVPYSEHSSFRDLSVFATTLKWRRMIPTVNLSQHKEMERWFNVWKNYSE